jgi:hypothetical protein
MILRHSAYLVLLPVLLAVPALAQTRPTPIPEDSKRGYVRHIDEMVVAVNDKAMQLAPGAQIRNQQNLIIVPTAIPPGGAWADYVLNADGQVFRVWLLTPAELARPKQGAAGS